MKTRFVDQEKYIKDCWPDVDGIVFRYYQGATDHKYLVEVFDDCKGSDGVDFTLTLEDIDNHYKHIERCNLPTDMIFVEVKGEVVAYSRVGWYPETSGDRVYYGLGVIKMDWRRKGIGTAIQTFCENRLLEIAAEHPEDAPKFFQMDYDGRHQGRIQLAKDFGYEEVRWGYEMIRPIDRDLPETALPDGLVIRPVKESEYRAVFDAQNEAFRDHWGHVEGTDKDFQRFISSPRFDPSLWKVAWDQDQPAGMVLNFVNQEENEEFNRMRGYTEDISVGRPYRRQGLARHLLVESIKMFQKMGMEETTLGVDANNPNQALNLYEGVGYQTSRTWIICRKPFPNQL
jgi:ribosomal protein S18 acetylase RimI-like enzyme